MPFRPFARETAAARPATEEPQGRLSPLPAPEAWHGQLGGNGRRSGQLADLDLARGRVEVAISHFEGALEIDPASAALHNDAAVAYLERGRRMGSAFDFLAALRHSLRATELAPDSPAVRFNLALSFEALFLRHLAQRAWNGYLQLDSTSPWADEVRLRLVVQDGDRFQKGWSAWKAALARHERLARGALHEVVQSYPHQVRELAVEQLFPEVAGEIANAGGGPATTVLTDVAHAMAEQRGDSLLSDSLRALQKVGKGRPDLIAAQRWLAEGMSRYHAQDFRAADQLLAPAASSLHAAGSPLAWEADLYRSICGYYEHAGKAQAQLRKLLTAVDPLRFPSVAGRTLWMLGTIAMVQGRHEDAIAAFRQMRSLLLRGAGEDQAAMADEDLAANYELRGEVERGWYYRFKAIRILIPCGDPRRRHSVLFEAAQALARRHQLDLALAFLDEVIANAPEWGEPLARAEAFSVRARVRADLDDPGGAKSDADEALRAVAAMPPGGLRQRLEGAAFISLGRARLAGEPARATSDLEHGEALELATGWLNDRTLALTSIASAKLALGEVSAARNSLVEAVHGYESTRMDAIEVKARIAIFEQAQQAFDALVASELTARDPSREQAFLWADRARGRYFADSWAQRKEIPPPGPMIDAPRLLRLLPPRTTMIEIAVLPDKTVIWTAEGGKLSSRVTVLAREQLELQVNRFRQALEIGDAAAARQLGAALYDRLLRPLHLAGSDQRLVIVPDGPLERLPFAALYDRVTGRYLVERATLTLAPSATMVAVLLALPHSSTPAAQIPALIVGAPDLRGTGHADLDNLPGAVEEAESIAKLYPRRVFLLGRGADRDSFLRELPRCQVLHFAGHALALDHGGDSSLLLLSPASPADEGEVTAADIRALNLSHVRLVVLAACRSSAGWRSGREGELSLAASFLAAGVPSVIAAAWKLDDSTSPLLMARLHALVASGTDPPTALHDIILQCLHSPNQRLRSPTTWAAFTALGI